MRQIPNDIVKTLIRTLPIILDGIESDNMVSNIRLANSVRLTKKIINRLKTIEHEQSSNNKQG